MYRSRPLGLNAHRIDTFHGLVSDVVRLDKDLAAMEISGKVDFSIDDVFERIVSFVTRREQFWFQGEPDPKTFAAYHAWRNLRLIFTKMRTRLADSSKADDNPLVVDQARAIVIGTLSMLPSLISIEREPSDTLRDQVLHYVRQFRWSARQVNMIPSGTEEIKEVDRAKLTEIMDELLNRMAAIVTK